MTDHIKPHSSDLFKIELNEKAKVDPKALAETEASDTNSTPKQNPQNNGKQKNDQKQEKQEKQEKSKKEEKKEKNDKQSPSISKIEDALLSYDPKEKEENKNNGNADKLEQNTEQGNHLYKWPSEYNDIKSGVSKNLDEEDKEKQSNKDGTQRSGKSKDKKHYQEKKPKYREKLPSQDQTNQQQDKKPEDNIQKDNKPNIPEEKQKKQQNSKQETTSANKNLATSKPSSDQPIELYYWPIKGLAERIRLLLQYLSIKYQKKCFKTQEQYQDAKQKQHHSMLHLPYIKDGNDIIVQSEAIMIHLILKADRQQLLGRNNKQKVDIAQIRGHFGTFHSEYIMLVYGDYDKNKDSFIKNAKCYLKSFQDFMGENEYMCGEITYVDFLLAEFFEILRMMDGELMAGFPKLMELKERVFEEPKIKEYIESDEFLKTPLNSEHAKWNGEKQSKTDEKVQEKSSEIKKESGIDSQDKSKKSEIKQEIKDEVKDEVKKDIKQDIKEDVKQDVKQSVKQDIKPDIKEEVKEEVEKKQIEKDINKEEELEKASKQVLEKKSELKRDTKVLDQTSK